MPDRYDVAISFAGEDRAIARQIAESLREHDVNVFFDEYAAAELWGKDLYQHLTKIYEESRLCIVILSESYQQKEWTKLEWRSLSAVSRTRDSFTILPIQVGPKPKGWSTSNIAINWSKSTPSQVAAAVVQRLQSIEKPKPTGEPSTYHVIKRESGWSLKRAGSTRATSLHETRAKAVTAGKELAKRHAPAELIVHNSDGTIALREMFAEEGK